MLHTLWYARETRRGHLSPKGSCDHCEAAVLGVEVTVAGASCECLVSPVFNIKKDATWVSQIHDTSKCPENSFFQKQTL